MKCPKCGSEARSVAKGIVWCDSCKEHHEAVVEVHGIFIDGEIEGVITSPPYNAPSPAIPPGYPCPVCGKGVVIEVPGHRVWCKECGSMFQIAIDYIE